MALFQRMQIDRATGLLAGVKQVLSPHFDARPAGIIPHLIVVHGISLPPGSRVAGVKASPEEPAP